MIAGEAVVAVPQTDKRLTKAAKLGTSAC